MNSIQILGRLGRDPEVRTSAGGSGKTYCRFSVAVRAGKDETQWFDCVAFDKTASLIGEYLKKGDLAAFEGSMRSNTVTSEKDGDKRTYWSLNVQRFHFASGKRPNGEATPDSSDDEVPF